MAAGQLKGIVGEEFSLDVVRIRAAEGGPQVELGKYLTDDLYIAYERGAADSTVTTTTPVVTNNVRVEYSPFDFLTLESDIGEAQSGGDVFFKFEYDLPFFECSSQSSK
jgi:autotransporter translocation and assembly factor TamB